jgi:hypothetical protein
MSGSLEGFDNESRQNNSLAEDLEKTGRSVVLNVVEPGAGHHDANNRSNDNLLQRVVPEVVPSRRRLFEYTRAKFF